MSNDDKIRVRARGTALVTDFDALEREPALRRFLGRKYEQVKPGQWGWVPSGQAEACAKRAEVARAMADGDLWPADQATASWAASVVSRPVQFDPAFGVADAVAKASGKPAKESA